MILLKVECIVIERESKQNYLMITLLFVYISWLDMQYPIFFVNPRTCCFILVFKLGNKYMMYYIGIPL